MDKIVLITGASSGIGEGCARKFASEGARLILNARSVDKLEALAQELKEKYGTSCYVMPFDVRDRKAESQLTRAGTHKQKLLWKIKQHEFSKKHRFILNPDCLSTKHVLFTQ